MGWPERYARELARIAEGMESGLSREEIAAMLSLSREVAHRTERRWAPVSTYVAGRFVAPRLAAGIPLSAALSELVQAAQEILPKPAGEPTPGGKE